jgi:hypothetical protein
MGDKKPVKAGDHFLKPFTGARRDLLVKAVRPSGFGEWQWYTVDAARPGRENICLLSSCTRVSPSLAKRILKEA